MTRMHRWGRWWGVLLVVAGVLLGVATPVGAAPDVDAELAIAKQAYDDLLANFYTVPDTIALLTGAWAEAESALRSQADLPPLDGDSGAQWQTFETGVRSLAARSTVSLSAGDFRRRLILRMVRVMNDGHTFYLTKQATDARKTVLAGDNGIVDYGYSFVMYNFGFYIGALIPGGNMETAGGRVGDHLLAIDGRLITRDNYARLIAVQDEGVTHVFTVFHRGESDPVHLTVTLHRYVRQPLVSRVVDGHIGYIRAFSYSYRDLVDKLDATLAAFHAQNVDSLVLDLRGNPGGQDTIAQQFLGRFVPDGTILGTDVGRIYARQSPQSALKAQKIARSDGRDPEALPMVVLVNDRSVSWSEMTALALREFVNAPLIGTKTKGLLGNDVVYGLRDGSALGITVGVYTSAHGQSLNGVGVTPDLFIANPTPEDTVNARDSQLAAAIDRVDALVHPVSSTALPLAA